jgi:hypothetical protein
MSQRKFVAIESWRVAATASQLVAKHTPNAFVKGQEIFSRLNLQMAQTLWGTYNLFSPKDKMNIQIDS